MKIVEMIIKALLGSLLMISLLGLIGSYEVNHTLLNKEFLLEKLNEKNYYENLYSNIINEMKGYIEPSGLEEKVLENIISIDKIKNDVNIMINNIYENQDKELEMSDIENKLEINMKEFLRQENLNISNNEENIQEFSEKMVEEYKKGISYNTYYNYGKKISFAKIQKILEKVKIVCLAVTIFSVMGYGWLIRKKDMKNIYEIMIFVLSSGIMITSSVIFITTKLKIDYITILNDAVSIIIRDVTKNILKDMANIGGILIVVSLFIIILCNILKERKVK